ncbi:hypothetical protein AVEN_70360-1 [Araneus ventricosus]|uniref:Uncharacterized protein n=1 Tax=Araneus ventricosus TaxID=182803 RepID=A0A4Y2MDZ8_ARAVE|nr:hypothetical protein AVEN_70360-1 [Araneus ventricosus]
MLQSLWKDNVSRDDPTPKTILNSGEEFASLFEVLKSIEIPRFLKGQMKVDSRIEMHGYCDGSGKAYSAMVYLRIIPCEKDAGKVVVVFVAANTRVNPIEPVTLPRIEMHSALLLAPLSAPILKPLPIQMNGVYLWSDSQIVLSWIHLPPRKGNQFVLNRLTQIISLVPQAQWNHIAGTSNPTDCAYRGLSPSTLLNHPLWWSGPQWLSSHEPFSPSLIETFVIEPEFDCVSCAVRLIPDFLLKFSSFSRLSRVVT